MTVRSIVVNISANAAPLVAGVNVSAAALGRLAAAEQVLAARQVATAASSRAVASSMGAQSLAVRSVGYPVTQLGSGLLVASRGTASLATQSRLATAPIGAVGTNLGAAAQQAQRLAPPVATVGTNLGGAARQARAASTAINAAGQAAGGMAARVGTLNPALIGGAGLVYGFRQTVGASIAFEHEFAMVRKVMDETDEVLGGVARSIRRLSTEMPVVTTELNAIAAGAGRMGVAAGDMEPFVRSIAMLNIAIEDMAPDQIAMSFARLATITRTPLVNVDQLGSVVVRLGNNFAATESEIVAFALRIAGAGTQIGMTNDQILALSTALPAMGLRAEMGGSAVSRILIEMAKAVDQGGSKLDEFARVSGMTVEQFATAWRRDAAGALLAFLQGLDAAGEAGESTFEIIAELGLQNLRTQDTLLRGSTAADEYARALRLAGDEAKNLTALEEEYQTLASTTQSQWRQFVNSLREDLRLLGDAVAPATNRSLQFVNEGRAGRNVLLDALPGDYWSDYGNIMGRVLTGQLSGVIADARSDYARMNAEVAFARRVHDEFSDSVMSVVNRVTDMAEAVQLNNGRLRTTSEVIGSIGGAVQQNLTDRAISWFERQALAATDALEAMDDYYDRVRSLADPLYAYTEAVKDAEGAQAAINEAIKDKVPLEEMGGLYLDLYSTTTDLADASDRLGQAFTDGTLSIGQITEHLNGMVAAGVITREEAGRIVTSIIGIASAAKETEGTYEVVMDGRTAEAEVAIQRFREILEGLPPIVQTILDAIPEPARRAVISVLERMGLIPPEIATELRAIDAARPVIDWVRGALARLDGSTATVRIRTVEQARLSGAFGLGMADGGIVRYGSGGIENHVAQIAPAGAMRLWAEPETGGEAYIPLAATKRGRSREIWAETGRRLGVLGFASGGLAGRESYDLPTLWAMTRSASFGDSAAHLRAIGQMRDAYRQMALEVERWERAQRRAALVATRAAAETADQRKRATEALREFDRETKIAEQRRQIEARIAQAEANQRLVANREAYEFDRMVAIEQVRWLDRRMAAEIRFSDEWMRLHGQRRQLLAAEAQDARRAADELVEGVQRMLAIADRRLSDLDRQLSLDVGRDGWAWSAETLTAHIGDQLTALADWQDALEQARSRGLSSDAIEALGLDAGPEALAQVQVLLRATDDELEQLSDAIATRAAALSDRVAREAADVHSQLGAELAAAGEDQARAWVDAMVAGINSGIPLIIAAVREARQAVHAAQEAEARAGSAAPIAEIRRMLGLPADPASDRIWVDRIGAGTHTLTDAIDRIGDKAGGTSPVAFAATPWSAMTAAQSQVRVVERVVERLPESITVVTNDSELGRVVVARIESTMTARDRAMALEAG